MKNGYASRWESSNANLLPIDDEILEESALAGAQAAIQNVMDRSGLKKADVARKMGRPASFISRMLRGGHNLTVKTLARALAACGFEVRFVARPIHWGWLTPTAPSNPKAVPGGGSSDSHPVAA